MRLIVYLGVSIRVCLRENDCSPQSVFSQDLLLPFRSSANFNVFFFIVNFGDLLLLLCFYIFAFTIFESLPALDEIADGELFFSDQIRSLFKCLCCLFGGKGGRRCKFNDCFLSWRVIDFKVVC